MSNKVIVCGGRDYYDADLVAEWLDLYLCHDVIVVHGDAAGADRLCAWWAQKHGHQVIAVPADWKKKGKAAGPIRNKLMLDVHKPTLVIAFPGGNGTKNMMLQARACGVEVIDIEVLIEDAPVGR